jgi:hypothetical protein
MFETEYFRFISPISSQKILGLVSLFNILIIKEKISISEHVVDNIF